MANRPLRLSEIKGSVFSGLRFDRILSVGWEIRPSIGIVAKDIKKLGLDLETFRVPLEKSVRLVMMPSIHKNFVAQGRPTPWEPLAEYTKFVRGVSGPILRRTGDLERAASSFGIWTIGITSATIKSLPSNVWYGALHQAGYGSLTDIARRKLGPRASAADVASEALSLFLGETPARKQSKFVIPQREFILFQEEDLEAIQEIFIDWMEDQAAQVGRAWNRLP
jgi:phage gpG-like protein